MKSHDPDSQQQAYESGYRSGYRDALAGKQEPSTGVWDFLTAGLFARIKGSHYRDVDPLLSVDRFPVDLPMTASEEADAAAAFQAAAAKLLDTLEHTLADMRQERIETRAALVRLASSLGHDG